MTANSSCLPWRNKPSATVLRRPARNCTRCGGVGFVGETRWKLDQLKEAATVEGLRLVPLARSTGADERTDEPLVDVDEEIRAEAL